MKVFEIKDIWYFAIAAVVCYLIGCFNFAVLIAHFKKKDIRELGSGNPGTMNMTRSLGLKFGAINYFCDVFKGGLPVLAGYFIFKGYVFAGTEIPVSDFARYFFGLFVIIGHIFPVTMKFKGGKGIASTMGIFMFALPCETWWYIFIIVAFLIGILFYIIFTEWGSMGSLIGITVPSIFQAVIFAERYSGNLLNGWSISIFVILLVINLLTWIAHRKNIVRLLAGEEHRTVVRKHK
ncbi:MAG: glycerol-3-phosphate acyltransferase [Clostridia bacterium]|nr:glycerol-3-phosphate acyltransferase [Clostridia bacterium]